MSEFDNADLPMVDELTTLKARADLLGISYHPSIGVEKLREKINAAVEPKADEVPAASTESETPGQKRARLQREAAELVRVRVSCMNPFRQLQRIVKRRIIVSTACSKAVTVSTVLHSAQHECQCSITKHKY